MSVNASVTRFAAKIGRVPELPEVESVARQLAPKLTGRRIVDVWWDDHPAARISDLARATDTYAHQVIRRGKFLLVPLTPHAETSGPPGDPIAPDAAAAPIELVLHLGMTGSFTFEPTGVEKVSHVRARLFLDNATTLAFRDPRRFGRASVVDRGAYHGVIPTLATLGPEPLSENFDARGFAAALAATRAPIKAVLLGQKVVAGVGNIYADEALWRAKIHPGSRRVGAARAALLRECVIDVLTESIEREGTTFRDYQLVNGSSGSNLPFLDAYGRAGKPCRRCRSRLHSTVIAGRTTIYCRRCQRA